MNINIDKSTWKLVKLGDVATEYSKRINNPSESEFERFVGSSNIGQWDFRIKSWEDTSSVTSAMKLFEPKDYLLVRRSLYASDFRERAPRATFPGVCSGDILTIREKRGQISDGFLIGVLNSPQLWKFVVANASGSITRRIKWRDLANYQFLLPPKTEQARLAELLWAGDKVLEGLEGLSIALSNSLATNRESLISEPDYPRTRLDLICEKKISYGIVQAGPHIEGGMPYIKSSNLSDEGILVEELQRTSNLIAKKYQRSQVFPGDLIFSLRGNLGQTNIVPSTLQVANLTQGTARISVKKEYSNRYIKHALDSLKIQRRIAALSKGSTFKEISLGDLRSVRIPIPSTEEADRISRIIESIQGSRRILNSKLSNMHFLQKSLINQIF